MFRRLALSLLAISALSGCGIRSIPMAKNDAEASLAEITNQYKRRADLIPNLVEVVKGFAKHEKGVLVEVTEARAKATQMTIDPSHATPAQLADYAKAQGQLSQALGRLMVITENYPQIRANENFKSLQDQLEGTENRIAVARQRYIESVKGFNNEITVFPSNITNSLLFHYEKMAQWDLEPEEKKAVEKAPTVKF